MPARSYANSIVNIWNTAKLFFKEAVPLYIPPAMHEGFNFSTSLPTFVIVCLLIITILLGEKWYLNVVFTFLSRWLMFYIFQKYI